MDDDTAQIAIDLSYLDDDALLLCLFFDLLKSIRTNLKRIALVHIDNEGRSFELSDR